MKLFHRGKIARGDGVYSFFKDRGIVGVREKIAVVEHVNPGLAIGENLCGKRFFEDLPQRDRRDNKPAFFQEIFDRLPGQLEGILKPLDDSFFFQKGKFGRTFLQCLMEEQVGSVEVLKALFPANVWRHGPDQSLPGLIRIADFIIAVLFNAPKSKSGAGTTQKSHSKSFEEKLFFGVHLPVDPPVLPMLAKRVDELPIGEMWIFKLKWDGFRALVFRGGNEILIQRRDEKPLNPLKRYFPELLDPLESQLSAGLRARRRNRDSQKRRTRLRCAPASSSPGCGASEATFPRDPGIARILRRALRGVPGSPERAVPEAARGIGIDPCIRAAADPFDAGAAALAPVQSPAGRGR